MATQGAAEPGALASGRPPASTECRRGNHPDHGVVLGGTVVDESDQRGPHGYAAHVVLGPVDRVEDPAASRARPLGVAELLADHGVVWPLLGQPGAQHHLGRAVGIAHGRQVGLGLDDEVEGLKPAEGE